MFNLNVFVMETLDAMIGKEPEYKVRQYALGWFEKNVLTEDDLAYMETRYTELEAERTEAECEAEELTPEDNAEGS